MKNMIKISIFITFVLLCTALVVLFSAASTSPSDGLPEGGLISPASAVTEAESDDFSNSELLDVPVNELTELSTVQLEASITPPDVIDEKNLRIETTPELVKRGILPRTEEPILLSADFFTQNTIVAYYGHPRSKMMGILGRYPIDVLADRLTKTAAKYDNANGSKGVVTAFYLIYGVCHPKGEVGHMNDELVKKYVQFAQKHGMLVFLDHQIGKYPVEYAMKKLLPFLKYPNVHLAIDPEWRTLKPMKEIGRVYAHELNDAQKMMRDYMLDNGIKGHRMLVVHQFKPVMIQNIPEVKASYDPVVLVHNADGFGSPGAKRSAYQINARAKNIPFKGFKLFYYSGYKGAGYDKPLMTPEQVLNLKPEPFVIMYQ
ncbi:MAG: hypothetical protein PF637_03780 [Spirochaetes bacterium]|jgi:hypothetical protein|nr:hypothetical protein [Spirochaetota bacterium]